MATQWDLLIWVFILGATAITVCVLLSGRE